MLTKPLGSGVLFNATRAGKYDFKELEKYTLPVIAELNKRAMDLALDYELHACTDITGFGILGHCLEMAVGSKSHVLLDYRALKFYPGALEMYKKGVSTGSNRANQKMVAGRITIEESLGRAEEELLYDPQTSGGVLLSLPKEQGMQFLQRFGDAARAASAIIGSVSEGPAGVTVC